MKKKIVIKVSMNSEKCRSKALKIAAAASGVSSVALEGKDRDQLVVTGEEVDAVCLTKVLRKKFQHAAIDSMEDVKEKKKEEKPKEKELLCYCGHQFPQYAMYHVYDDSYASNCTIV